MAEYQRAYKTRLMADGKWSEAEKSRKYRERLKLKMETAGKEEKEKMIEKKKLLQNERKRRQRKQLRERKEDSQRKSPTSFPTSSVQVSSFGSRQSRGKALWKARRALPFSPRKRKEVCSALTSEVGLTTKLPQKGRRQNDLDARIVQFYRSDPISRATPGKKDSRSFELPDGSRERRQLRYMTLSIGEAYAAFKEEEQMDMKLGKSKFFSLRPPEVLHERQIPASVCVCQVHAGMDWLLKGLSKSFPAALPATGRELIAATACSRDSETCMLLDCDTCKENLGTVINGLTIDNDALVKCVEECQDQHPAPG